MTIRRTLFTLILIVSCFSNAHASLISRDLAHSGDGLLTYDSQSGLEWLDLTQSAGLTLASIAHETAAGGRYEGFQLANLETVKALFLDAGWTGNYGEATDTANVVAAYSLVTMLGMTANFGSEAEGAQIAIGRVSDVLAGPGTTTSIHVDYDYSRPARATAYYSLAPWTSESGSQAIGAFLYRQAAVVPEPTTVSLLAAGLMLLIWRSRTVGTRA